MKETMKCTRLSEYKMQGAWVDMVVDFRSIRQALGLPQHNLFCKGIFHQYKHPDVQEDMDDVDHME